MGMLRTTTLVLAIAIVLPLLSACHQPNAGDTAAAEAKAEDTGGLISRAVNKQLDKARKELREGNISLNKDGSVVRINSKDYGPGKGGDNLPKAEITPDGDLLIEGQQVAIDADQRALLLAYREEIITIADAGIAIGGKGVDLAGAAMQQAVGAIFSGNTEELEQHIESEAESLKAEVQVLCKQLPSMLGTQQQLAASLPEFKPYATMTQDDVDDCARNADDEGNWSVQ